VESEPLKPRLLIVSPVPPNPRGTGVQQRTFAMLSVLGDRFEIHLAVLPVFGEAAEADLGIERSVTVDPAPLLSSRAALATRIADPLARERAILALPFPWAARFSTPAAVEAIADWIGGRRFDALLVHRLYMAPLIPGLMAASGATRTVLDLDDDEALSHRRLADTREAAGDGDGARFMRAQAVAYDALSQQWFAAADGVAVCSTFDRGRLEGAYPAARFRVVPNIVDAAAIRPRPATPSERLRLLFVGALGYGPNFDAVIYLCRHLAPALRTLLGGRLAIRVAGRSPPAELDALCAESGVELHASPADLAPLYADTDIALVPIRAGGGTRLKILEAFAYGTPVVSTPIGAEGLEAVPGQQLLIADLDGFAEQIMALANDPARAARIAASARQLVEERYGPAALSAALLPLLEVTAP
jgi:glycosyltransferase involved in cell wall biosynthesis